MIENYCHNFDAFHNIPFSLLYMYVRWYTSCLLGQNERVPNARVPFHLPFSLLYSFTDTHTQNITNYL